MQDNIESEIFADKIPPRAWMFVACDCCVLSLRWADPLSRVVFLIMDVSLCVI
jgi:hypothetical protein